MMTSSTVGCAAGAPIAGSTSMAVALPKTKP